MLLEAHIAIVQHEEFAEALKEGTSVVLVTSDRESDFFIVKGHSRERIDRFLRALEAYMSIEIIDQDSQTVSFKSRTPTDGVIARIVSTGASILYPSYTAEGVQRHKVIVSSRRQLDAVVAILKEVGEVTVERVSHVHASALGVAAHIGDLTSNLTSRQLQVLELAVERGYFDTPRRCSLTELAKALDIAPATVGEHLRKAEREAATRFVAAVSSHPILAAAAKKKPGRPKGSRKLPRARDQNEAVAANGR